MTDSETIYNRRAIYELLLEAFTPEALQRFCRFHDSFAPILKRFGPKYNLEDMAREVMGYCQRKGLWAQLLAGVKEHNEYQYSEFESRLHEPNEDWEGFPGAPYQPPRPLAEFVGRADELERLTQVLKPGSKAAITGVVGMGGLGKTELAKRAADKVASRFRDGVLWADCRQQDLVTIADLWAAAYGEQLSGDDEASKTAAWRSLANGKEALLIFDDVQPGQDVEPLVPARSRCAVLLTTRHGNHPALQGAERLDLQRFTEAEAEALVDEILGAGTAAAQAEDAGRLFKLVGYLPLGLNVALRLAQKCGWTLAVLAGQLEEAGALVVLGDEKRLRKSLNVVFETAYDCLPKELQEAFRTLALFNEGASFHTISFAATTGLEEAEAGGRLHRLAGRSLLERAEEDRWSLHTLLREFAARLPAMGEAAWRDFARHYVEVLGAANDLYLQGGEDMVRGLAIYDREGPHIRAGQAWAARRAEEDEGAAWLCSAYPNVAGHILYLRLRLRTWAHWLDAAARAAHRLGDKEAEGNHLGNLGSAYVALGETPQAIDYYEQALVIAREIGNRYAEGVDLSNLGSAYAALGETRQAIDYYEQALTIHLEIGDRRGEGIHLGNLGAAYAALGEIRQAIDYYEQALTIHGEIGDRLNEGMLVGNLGSAYAALGETRQAIDYYEQALVILREIGDRRGEGNWLGNLGDAYKSLGETRQAIDYYEQALVIAREIGDRRNEGAGLGGLGLAYAALGETRQAIDYFQQALVILRDSGDRRNEGTLLGSLGNAYYDLGETWQAIDFHQQALAIAREIGDRRGEGIWLGNLGKAYYVLGEIRQAIDYFEQALVILRDIGDRRGEGNHLANLGIAYYNLGDPDRARESWTQALAIYEAINDPIAERVRRLLEELET